MRDTARLAAQVRAWRTRRRLSLRAAARHAGVRRETWERWEAGSLPRDSHYAAIQHTLGWEEGSVEAVLGGGNPTPVDRISYVDPETGEVYADTVERRLWELWPALALEYGDGSHAEALGRQDARAHIYQHRARRASRVPLNPPGDVT